MPSRSANRQYSKDVQLSTSIVRSLDHVTALLDRNPIASCLWNRMSSRFVAASDAAQEAVREGLAGALCPTGWVPAGPGHAGLPNLVWPLV